jgi:hypothetical protein
MGYDFELRMESGLDPVQTFKLKDKVDVRVARTDGTFDEFFDVKKITIREASVTRHHRTKDPPGDG